MVPSYFRPSSVSEAVRLKAELGSSAVYLAGGTEVNNRSAARPSALIDLSGLGLNSIKATGAGLSIGSGVTFQELVDSPLVPEVLKNAAMQMANRNIRQRATVGGHLAVNRSCGDLIPALLAANARVWLVDSEVELEVFLAQQPSLIVSVFVPSTDRSFGIANLTRTASDISLVSACASVSMEQGLLMNPILAVGGVAAHVVRLHAVEQALDGRPVPEPREVEALIASQINPVDDHRGSAEFKRHIASVLGTRSLLEACSRRISGVESGHSAGLSPSLDSKGPMPGADHTSGVETRPAVTLNGTTRVLKAELGENLRDVLRREGILSVRNGCDGEGSCGACAVLIDGQLLNTCHLLVGQVLGSDIRTVEGLARPRELTSLQSAFVDAGVVQCGYCSGAMLMAIAGLLERIPNPGRDDIKDALSGVFCRCTGYEQVFEAVQLAINRKNDPAVQFDAPRFRDGLKYVGSAHRKVDGYLLARGEAAFVEDKVRPGHCHLKVLPSPHAHAYITSIDTSRAEALPGVVAVFTHKNCPDVWYNPAGQGFPEPSPYDRRMFDQKLRHVGDRVAAVVAETAELCDRALSLIDVTYEVLRPVLTIDEAKAPGAPVVHNAYVEYIVGAPKDLDTYNQSVDPREGRIIYQFPIHADPHKNLAASVHGGIGDIDKGFADAEVIHEQTYESAQVQCTPVEPHIVYSRMEGERLVLHASTQVPWHVRRIIARILGIKESRLRVIKERVGGGFGSKQDMVLEEVAAYATWVTGRDVLYRYTREDEFINSRTRHTMRIRVKLGAKKDGRLTAMHMDLEANTGPYGSHCLTVPMNACSKSLPLFLCDNVRFDVHSYYTNIAPTGAYQGYGAPKGSFALQLAAAELAKKLGMDPLDFIEKNRVREGVMLEILRCLGEGREGAPQLVHTCGLGPALEQGRKLINWGVKNQPDNPDIRIGQGVAIIQQGSGLPGLDSANAAISMFGDGTFIMLSGGTDLGTGLDTVTVKLAAETLKVPMENIAVLSADTDATPFDVGAYASSGTYFSGGAALNAALKMKKLLLAEAADMLQEPENHLELVWPGAVKGLSGSVTYEEIARRTQSGTGHGQLLASAHFITDKGSFPYGAHFCEVAVDIRTGKVKILKYYALQDAGTPINPELALGQMYGGVLKTIGHSLYEEMIYDDKGKCLNPNFLDYKVPQIGDLPEDFKAILVDTNDPFGPMGAKSISEISCNGAAPCLAAAIHDAVGVWVRTWPFTPEKILRALGQIGKGNA